MTGMEIVLLILGMIIFAASFIIPERKKEADEKSLEIGEEKVKEIIDGQMKEAKEKLQDVVDETLTYAVEKSERSLERISNEKITAVSEFSETVLEDIHKSHQEVMFLYDMLHDKQKNLRETAKEVDRTSAIAKETKNELENAAKMFQEELVQEQEQEPAEAEPETIAVPEVDVENISGSNNNEKILEMHKQGKSNVAIAKELGLGVGEVKLVIDLFEVI
ncbi:MAG: DUF6115 domain-containing protein [Lachnospiraceae bacterium]